MNMLTKVTPDAGELKSLGAKFSTRPLWQRAAIVGSPLVLLAATATIWSSDPSPAAAPTAPTVTVAAPIERNVNPKPASVSR